MTDIEGFVKTLLILVVVDAISLVISSTFLASSSDRSTTCLFTVAAAHRHINTEHRHINMNTGTLTQPASTTQAY